MSILFSNGTGSSKSFAAPLVPTFMYINRIFLQIFFLRQLFYIDDKHYTWFIECETPKIFVFGSFNRILALDCLATLHCNLLTLII